MSKITMELDDVLWLLQFASFANGQSERLLRVATQIYCKAENKQLSDAIPACVDYVPTAFDSCIGVPPPLDWRYFGKHMHLEPSQVDENVMLYVCGPSTSQKKIEAIKELRNRTKVGLKEAKDTVEGSCYLRKMVPFSHVVVLTSIISGVTDGMKFAVQKIF